MQYKTLTMLKKDKKSNKLQNMLNTKICKELQKQNETVAHRNENENI